MNTNKYDAVFFISFGGPEKREDVMPFLEIVTRGRGIPAGRLQEVAHHYDEMGGASPINAITAAQAEALKKVLAERKMPYPVYIGQRNWHPFIEDTLRRMMVDGIKRAIGFVTAAHRCEASLERYIKAVDEAREKIGPGAPEIDYVDPWFNHPLFIEAICQRIQEEMTPSPSPLPKGRGPTSMSTSGTEPLAFSLQGEGGRRPDEGLPWVFTAHSIPTPMAEASRYVQELETTARLVCQKLGRAQWTLAYTSRSGRPTDPWLEPDVCDVIRAQAEKGVRDIVLIPIGFVADHVEVLYDLDVEAAQVARETGVKLHRAKTVGDHPVFIHMIADVIQKRRAAQALRPETSALR